MPCALSFGPYNGPKPQAATYQRFSRTQTDLCGEKIGDVDSIVAFIAQEMVARREPGPLGVDRKWTLRVQLRGSAGDDLQEDRSKRVMVQLEDRDWKIGINNG